MKFVEMHKQELAKYKLVGVVPLSGIPDRLVQATKNRERAQVKFIIGKKTLLTRILESQEHTKPLVQELTGMSAIILSNEDPFKLYRSFKANTLKLGAKPNSISPEDINIQSGETSIQPGQAVTELKQAGIDVKIDKGKVVISKDKVLVKKGEKITTAVAKALKTLDIQPFSASIEPSVLYADRMFFRRDILSITPAIVSGQVATAFTQAFAISMKGKIVNQYTLPSLIGEAYRSAIALGIEGKIPEPGISDKLLANAALQAAALNAMVKEPPAEQPAAST